MARVFLFLVILLPVMGFQAHDTSPISECDVFFTFELDLKALFGFGHTVVHIFHTNRAIQFGVMHTKYLNILHKKQYAAIFCILLKN